MVKRLIYLRAASFFALLCLLHVTIQIYVLSVQMICLSCFHGRSSWFDVVRLVAGFPIVNVAGVLNVPLETIAIRYGELLVLINGSLFSFIAYTISFGTAKFFRSKRTGKFPSSILIALAALACLCALSGLIKSSGSLGNVAAIAVVTFGTALLIFFAGIWGFFRAKRLWYRRRNGPPTLL